MAERQMLDREIEVSTLYECHAVDKINSNGIWFGDDPLSFSVPLLLLQLSLISIFTRSIYILLKPFGQPSIVSQILGGAILGPSVLGCNSKFAAKVFPVEGRTVLETFSVFGFMFFIFLIGVKMDASTVLHSGKRTFAVGCLGFFVPLAFGKFLALILGQVIQLDDGVRRALHMVIRLESDSSFPVIACFLYELKILNSELGRLASNASIVSDICHWSITIFIIAVKMAVTKSPKTSMGSLLSFALLIILIVFGFRPAALWVIRHTPEGKPVREIYIFLIFVALLCCGLLGELIGVSAFFSSFILGLVIPDGPPLGAAIVERLECFVSVLLMPIFFTMCGLKMNVFAIQKLENVGVLQLFVLVGFIGKMIGTALPPIFFRMPVRDAVSLGLIMNSKGIIDLAMLNNWRTENEINDECFAILIISVVVITGVVSPLVKTLYDPSRRFLAYKRRTIRHHHHNEELRVLACIHSLDNVRTMIMLLDASNPTKETPISLFVLHLIKLAGRASSLLIPHMPRDKSSQDPTQSERIFNVFRKFEQENRYHLKVHCYQGISPYASMHNDVCSLALEQRISFIIIPFHKQKYRAESSHVYRHLNKNVFEKAPCSVGVLIDRRNWRKSRLLLSESSYYQVAVLFFGGADDREAVAYAGRMSEHQTVTITLLHFTSSTILVGGTARCKMLDSEILEEFKQNASRNERVTYQEEMVMDNTSGALGVIRSVGTYYDLVIVGRRHGDSRFISDLGKRKENGDLGTLGEILASSDFEGGASVLVVQQQTKVWGLRDPEESTRLRRVKL
ncbi:cation/H(+) antiporter 15-like isoform X2 [Tripterygium wilfordii]|uniref:Cation/H(+) antiporter 15-like isoform X2 n=1 Tax=Tripterygium wilfordii TaxID=458696 RepID=A0A7J7BZM2_TRIWF|nr:cation/H(+) antiporter 15-like [Tripterygium wilfordii]KAF5727302.1 cation/H(+) antiporter 15-like isoform X2 [Tripterygium wilfordii]